MSFSLGSIKKISRLLKPKIEIGGLDISDGGILFLSIDSETKKIKSASIRLSEGVVIDGKIVRKDEFIESLKKLHQQIDSQVLKKIPVVVSISDANVYSQQFELPVLQESNLQEAVRLNLQVLSPIDFSKAYSDWQRIENPKTHGIEILASFIEKEIIDNLSEALLKSNFVPLAIEQKSASLARTIVQLAAGRTPKSPFFLLYTSSDGLGFSIIREDYLYFNRFTSWAALVKGQKRQVSFKEFAQAIIQESQKVMNFYSSHFNENISSLYIVAPGIEDQVKQIIEINFPFKVEPLVLKDFVIEHSWLAALGAALRGTIPRSLDTEISLAPQGTETLYFHSQILTFVHLWRNIIISVFVILFLAGVGLYLFLGQVINKSVADFQKIVGGYNVSYLSALRKQANDFNDLIEAATEAKREQVQWSKILSDIYAQAGKDITIERIYVQSLSLPVIVNGKASSANAAVDFKNRLLGLKFILDVDLPLSSLSVGADQTNFSLTFKIGNYSNP